MFQKIALVTALVVGSLLNVSAEACSLVGVDANAVRERMRTYVAHRTSVPLAEVRASSLTLPRLTFLRPLGADCSGLSTAFHSAAYHFTRVRGTVSCTHRGVVLMKGYGLTSPIEVQDSTTCISAIRFP